MYLELLGEMLAWLLGQCGCVLIGMVILVITLLLLGWIRI